MPTAYLPHKVAHSRRKTRIQRGSRRYTRFRMAVCEIRSQISNEKCIRAGCRCRFSPAVPLVNRKSSDKSAPKNKFQEFAVYFAEKRTIKS